jgi:predicted transcriptional regulator of viral defense system
MNDSSKRNIKGIGSKYRGLLSKVLRNSNGCITVKKIQAILKISSPLARTYLSRWSKNGWLKRARPGIYIPIDFETSDSSVPSIDPWILAEGLFSPCYIGGWSAAQYWDFTEQLFNRTSVFSSRNFNRIDQTAGGHYFIVRKISESKIFGLKIVWKDGVKIAVSDPHKTIIDVLDNPSAGGGIRLCYDFLKQYINSTQRDLTKMIEYAFKMKNGAIFKRLGYLLSVMQHEDQSVIEQCQIHISKGYSQLDPTIKGKQLIKKWRLWIPEGIQFND